MYIIGIQQSKVVIVIIKIQHSQDRDKSNFLYGMFF